jgi:hypothetical protein
MAAKKKGAGRKSGGRKYGKAAGKSVQSAMHRETKGTLKSGRGGEGWHGEEPQTGYCHRTFRGPQEGRQGSEEEESCIRIRGASSDFAWRGAASAAPPMLVRVLKARSDRLVISHFSGPVSFPLPSRA